MKCGRNYVRTHVYGSRKPAQRRFLQIMQDPKVKRHGCHVTLAPSDLPLDGAKRRSKR